MIKQLLSAVLAIVSLIVITGCGGNSEETIKIGVAGPLTGNQSKMGADVLNGVKLAVDQWNAKGGVLGKKIEIIQRDDEAKEQTAKTVALELINANVVGIIGHFNSGCTLPAADDYYHSGIPMITPSATNPYITERKDEKSGQTYWNVFRVCGRDDVQGERAARYVMEKIKAQRIAVVHDKTAYGQGLSDYFKTAVEKSGHPEQIVYYGGFSQQEKNFKPYLTTIQEKNPEVIFFGGMYDQGGLFAIQMHDMGIKAVLVSGDGMIDPEFIKTAGPSAEGSILTFAELLPFASDVYEKFPTVKKFNEEYKAKFDQPGPYSIYSYDAANILISSIQKANSTEGRKIADAIRNNEHECSLGKIKFNEKGDIDGSFYVIWEVKNGEFKFVEK